MNMGLVLYFRDKLHEYYKNKLVYEDFIKGIHDLFKESININNNILSYILFADEDKFDIDKIYDIFGLKFVEMNEVFVGLLLGSVFYEYNKLLSYLYTPLLNVYWEYKGKLYFYLKVDFNYYKYVDNIVIFKDNSNYFNISYNLCFDSIYDDIKRSFNDLSDIYDVLYNKYIGVIYINKK